MSTLDYDIRNPVEILIAEDSATQAEQLRFLLEESGYAVTVAADGRQALEATRRRKPTLLISDIVMPEMDGYALCQAIKTDEALKDLPVILVTTLAGLQDVVRGLECGADNFIRKPYEERHLLQRIRYLLASRMVRRDEKVQSGIAIDLDGERHFITSEPQQILDLLISTYEEAVRLNQNFERSYQTLNGLYRVAEGLIQCTTGQDVVETALERGLELPGVQAGWVYLRDGAGGLHLAAMRGLPPALLAPGVMDGECLCRRQLRAGKLDRVTNVLECDLLQTAKGDTHGPLYHALVPLSLGNDLLGVLNLVGEEEGLFSEEDLKILYAVGHQVGQALGRAHLHEHLERLVAERTGALSAEIAVRRQAEEEIRRQLQWLDALRAIDLAINTSLDLRIILNVVLDQLLQHLGVDGAAVLLLRRNAHTLEYAAGRGFRSPAIERSHPRLGEGHAGRAALERRTVHVPNLAESEATFGRARLLAGEQFVAYYAVPLLAKGEVQGVLEVFHRTPLDPDEEWLHFLEALASQTAIAVNNAGLYQELREYAAELEHRVAERTAEWESANEQLRQVQREISRALAQERELNELKSRFLSMTSHEFRTPLAAILSLSELLEHYASRLSEEKKLSYLHHIQSSVKRMTNLVDEVLLVEQGRAGRLQFDPKPLDLVPFCQNMIEEFRLGTGSQHQVLLTLEGLDDPSSLPAHMDEGLLHHILRNLLSNAIKYSPPGSRVSLNLGRQGERVYFTVVDQGIGIPAQDQMRLFEPFHRAGNVDAGSGSGLGLYIVKQAVDRHGGTIQVQSQEGQGTTFTVELPLAAAP